MQLSQHNIHKLRKIYALAGQPRRVRRQLSQLDFGEQVVPFGELQLLVNPNDNYTDRVVFFQGISPEPHSIKTLQSIITGKKALVLDVGANSGTFTTSLASVVGEGGLIRAFEPNPVLFKRLEHNVKLNKLEDKTETKQVALGSENGKAMLTFFRGNFGQASLVARNVTKAGAIEVEVLSLSDQFANCSDFEMTLMKVDIEGYEPDLFANFDKLVPKNHYPDYILIETAHAATWSYDLVAYLTTLGYISDFTDEGNTLFRLKK